jgi:PAS domain S-box-containing protein
MNIEALQKRLYRANKKVSTLETMIEEISRDLFIANERLTSIYEAMPAALIVTNTDGDIEYSNPTASELLGKDSNKLIEDNIKHYVNQVTLELISSFGDKNFNHVECEINDDSGEPIPVLLSRSKVPSNKTHKEAFAFVATDLRERKQIEIELNHAQKLESIGQLAAGIAHEINTPMQFIGDNVHFLGESFEAILALINTYQTVLKPQQEFDPELDQLLEDAHEHADLDYIKQRAPKASANAAEGITRVTEIVSAMRSFAHPTNEKVPLDINQAINTTLTVAKNEYKYVADIAKDLGNLPLVHAHAGDINQVILNLIVNAAHAIEAAHREERGTITITTWAEKECVGISISDTGTGISPDIQARVFDPFFTTKSVGQGTGQGLSMARRIIVEKHRGELTFNTIEGKQTTFYIKLPLGS